MVSADPHRPGRKRLLRTLIADITILPGVGPDTVRIGVCWRSGASEELTAERVSNICAARRSAPGVIEVVRRLGPATDNATLAQQLNAAGYRTGTGQIFDADSVRLIRRSYRIPPAALLAPGETTIADLADRLGVSRSTITSWLGTGLLTARRAATSSRSPPRRKQPAGERIAASPQIHQHAGTSLPAPGELSPRRGRRAPGNQPRRRLQLGQLRAPASTPRPWRTAPHPVHHRDRGRLPQAHRRLTTALARQDPSPASRTRRRTMGTPSPWYRPAPGPRSSLASAAFDPQRLVQPGHRALPHRVVSFINVVS